MSEAATQVECSVPGDSAWAPEDLHPASFRDWLAARCVVRLGRLDRFSWLHKLRLSFVKRLAHDGVGIRFATPYGFSLLLQYDYRGFVLMALDKAPFHPLLRTVLEHSILPGDTVVDGGSNVGFFSLFSARLLQGKGRVISFEPDPSSFGLLKKNVEWNGMQDLIRIEQKALTNTSAILDFFSVVEEPMRSSLLPATEPSGKLARVEGVRLDDYLAGTGPVEADIVKLDLEGGEPWALEGMAATLPAVRLLIFEVNAPQLDRLGVDCVDLVEKTARTGSFEKVVFADGNEDRFYNWDRRAFREATREQSMINVFCARRGVARSLLGS